MTAQKAASEALEARLQWEAWPLSGLSVQMNGPVDVDGGFARGQAGSASGLSETVGR